jgi:molybdate/tungstate transport system permease protein
MMRLSLFKRKPPDNRTLVFIVLGALMVLFILIPIVKLLFSSSPGTLWSTLCEDEVLYSILLTLYAGFVATLIGLFLGVPLAYLLARRNFRGKRILEGLIDVPIVIPHSTVGLALLFVFGSQFLFGKMFHSIGIHFFDALPGVVIAMMFVSVPFLIDAAKEGFKSVDRRLESVARTLGASSWQSFFRISLPLAWRSIFSGSIMMWARGISEFGAVLIIASWVPFLGGTYQVTPILVSDRFFYGGGWDAAVPVAALTILIALVVFIVLRTVAYRGERG